MQTQADIYILAIESSCDDTSAAVCKNGKVLTNISADQKIHAEYGGVVPELASRAHTANIVPVVDLAMKGAGIAMKDIHAIAYTRGPGLLGSLLVGAGFAKGMAQALNIPLVDVHHMKAHVMAHFINEPHPQFPFLCLTVSGGHTQIVKVTDYNVMEVLGSTIDDAAGEAFDKTAKMLGLPYPGGPLIDKYASLGNPMAFKFNEPNIPGLDYSFSGLKTSVLYFLKDKLKDNSHFIEENLSDLCASVQYTIIKILLKKLKKAAKETGIQEIAIAGGVSANQGLRKYLSEMAVQEGWRVYIPDFQYCTDNAGMIAISGYYKFLKGETSSLLLPTLARWEMNE
ncbi:MAG: tRNA (adenosine(37)-N6)-threonylcarbamoyltransferase complex transferase subunit TsaD [Chitinophagales bacterium]|nr:tRNA (adenosine(37)-N6)-threonylcarbamoyltransferase complex transferase subunit TsaD [Chitinophagales bacterium]MCZ2393134.1 tRNA (adenosine(37)-N6)-threonylcarbamoyltransferase complex transferase subunit TsaD [Chitinophagales bacterium]